MSNKAKIREEVLKLNPIDDVMFRKMAEEREFCEEILRVILDDSNLSVTESIPQWTGTNLQGRSVILDAKCVTGDGRTIDVEVQKSNNDDHQRRVRYNGAILTTNISDPGIMFENVPDVCIVFISRFDVFNERHSLYHIDRVIRETGTIVNNGFSEIYVNAKVKDGSEVSELMDVFTDDAAYSNKFPVTSSQKKHYKTSERGVETMCDIVQKLVDEERAEGRLEGRAESNEKTAKLIGILTKNNDFITLKQIADDPQLLEKLYKKFNL